MTRIILGLTLLLSLPVKAANRTGCDFPTMEKTLVAQFEVAPPTAHLYRLAFENFVGALDWLNIRLKTEVYQADLAKEKQDLLALGIPESHADYLISTMRQVRAMSAETGIGADDPHCTGLR